MSTQNKGPARQWHGIDWNGDGYAFDLKEDNVKTTGTYELCDSDQEKCFDDDLFGPVTSAYQRPDVTIDGLTIWLSTYKGKRG